MVEAVQQENKTLGQSAPHHSPAEEGSSDSTEEDCQADAAEADTRMSPTLGRCSLADSEGGAPHKRHSELAPSRPMASPGGPPQPTLSSLSSTIEHDYQGSGCGPESRGDGGGVDGGRMFGGSNASQMTGGVSDSFTEQTLKVITERVRRLDARYEVDAVRLAVQPVVTF